MSELLIVGLGLLALYLLFVIALFFAGRRESARALAGFAPEKAAGQFAEFTGEPLRAVVGGNARKA